MYLEDKDSDQRIEWWQWALALAAQILLVPVACIAISTRTSYVVGKVVSKHVEGFGAIAWGFVLLAVACFFASILFIKMPFEKKLRWNFVSVCFFAAGGITVYVLRPV